MVVFLYPGFTAETEEAEEHVVEELVRGKELELVLPEIFTAFHRFFMGSRRDLNEVLG